MSWWIEPTLIAIGILGVAMFLFGSVFANCSNVMAAICIIGIVFCGISIISMLIIGIFEAYYVLR